jgi:outer membrane lipoprotein-sorting protein
MTGNDWTGDPQDTAAGPSEPVLPEPARFDAAAPDPAFGGVIGSDIIEIGPPSPGRSSRRPRVLAASAAVVVVLAACGVILATQGSSQASPAAILTAAAHKSAAFSTVTSAFSEQIGSGLGTISGTGEEIRSPLKLSMQVNEHVEGQSVSLSGIIVSDTMYLKFGAMAGLPKSVVGRWIEFPLSGLAGGAFSSMLSSVENENPMSQIQMLLASKSVHSEGTDVIAGVQTNKYGGYFTAAAALKMLPAGTRSALGAMLKELQGDIHFTIWIDGNDRIRKLVETETIDSQPVTVTYTFTNYNRPLTITAPPPGEVEHIPASALAG